MEIKKINGHQMLHVFRGDKFLNINHYSLGLIKTTQATYKTKDNIKTELDVCDWGKLRTYLFSENKESNARIKQRRIVIRVPIALPFPKM